MLHHVSIGVSDVARAAEFYDAVMAALGCKRIMEFLPHAIGYGDAQPTFWIQLPRGQQELTTSNGGHVAFAAFTKDAVHAFHEAALAHGGKDDGAPGPRPEYTPDYYAAFVYDPFGNRLEVMLSPKPVVKKAPAKKAVKKVKAVKKAVKAAPAKQAPAKKAAPKKAPAKKAAPKKAAAKKLPAKKAAVKAAPKPVAPAKLAKPPKGKKAGKKKDKGSKKGKKK